jgi:hypothetical protein
MKVASETIAGSGPPDTTVRGRGACGGRVRLYRINKVTEPGGAVLKKKDVLAASDREALKRAEDSADCPVCEVLRDGQTIGSIVENEGPESPHP